MLQHARHPLPPAISLISGPNHRHSVVSLIHIAKRYHQQHAFCSLTSSKPSTVFSLQTAFAQMQSPFVTIPLCHPNAAGPPRPTEATSAKYFPRKKTRLDAPSPDAHTDADSGPRKNRYTIMVFCYDSF
jgi:hypothetical protein